MSSDCKRCYSSPGHIIHNIHHRRLATDQPPTSPTVLASWCRSPDGLLCHLLVLPMLLLCLYLSAAFNTVRAGFLYVRLTAAALLASTGGSPAAPPSSPSAGSATAWPTAPCCPSR